MDGLVILGAVVVFFWVVPVFAAHKMTKEKGYEPALGIVLGLFLGWIGVLVAAVLSPKDSRAVGPTKVCPHCAERVQWAAKVCKHCGRDVEALSLPGACSECGAPPAHPPTARCINCGAVKV